LPADLYEQESTQIDYDLGNVDNVFTKKYRQLGGDYNKLYNQKKKEYDMFVEDQKQRYNKTKQNWLDKQAIKETAKQAELESKLEVKATPVYDDSDTNLKGINFKKTEKQLKQSDSSFEETFLNPIEIRRSKKHNLFGDYESDRPDLRDYN
jgi:hypothetical protein